MAKLKRFLLYNGEKVVIGIVAAICLYVLYVRLFVPTDQLSVGDGEFYTVDRKDVAAQISKLRKVLKKKTPQLGHFEDTASVKDLIIRQVEQAQRPLAKVNWNWLVYVQPPRPLDRIGLKEIVENVGKEPPAAVQTAFGKPVGWEVYVTKGKILVICEDSDFARWPLDGRFEVLLQRKMIGEGRPDLEPTDREELLSRVSGDKWGLYTPPTEDGDDNDAAGEARDSQKNEQGDGLGELFGGRGENTPRSAATTAEVINQDQAIDDYIFRERDIDAKVRRIALPESFVRSKWETVAGAARVYTKKPNPETVFRRGLPREYKRAASSKRTSRKRKKSTPTLLPDLGALRPTDEGPVDNDIMGGDDTGHKKEGELDLSVLNLPVYKKHYYAWLDDTVSENVIYRYRLVARVKPKHIPEEIRARDEFSQWLPVAELLDRKVVYTKPPSQAYLKIWKAVHGKDLKAYKAFRAIAIPGAEFIKNRAAEKPSVLGSALPDPVHRYIFNPKNGQIKVSLFGRSKFMPLMSKSGQPTKLLQQIRYIFKADERAPDAWFYSDFAYTDIVLTPLGKRVLFRSVSKDSLPAGAPEDAVPLLRAKLFVEIVEDGETVRSRKLMVDQPAATQKIKVTDWLKKGKNNKVIWSAETLEPERKKLAEVYEACKDLHAVRIGEMQKGVDFKTEWELVDVRNCVLMERRFKIIGGKSKKSPEEEKRNSSEIPDGLTGPGGMGGIDELGDPQRHGGRSNRHGRRTRHRSRSAVARRRSVSAESSSSGADTEVIRKPIGKGARPRAWHYIVVREANVPVGRLPRYRRILRLPYPRLGVNQEVEREIVWLPKLEAAIDKQVMKRTMFKNDDLRNLRKFLLRIDKGKKVVNSPEKRIYDLFDDEMHDVIYGAAKGIMRQTMTERALILKGLNAAMMNPDFADPKLLDASILSAELQEKLQKVRKGWRIRAVVRVNRAILLAVFKDELGARPTP